MDRFTEEELAIAKSVDLVDVAAALGYTPKRIGRYHTLKEMDSMRIYNRKHWCRFSRRYEKGECGGSQIDFLMVFAGMDIKETVAWLLDFAGYRRSQVMSSRKELSHQVRFDRNTYADRKFELPEPAYDNSYLYSYLTKERGLSKEVVDFMVCKELIYESRHYHNIVFKGNDKGGITRFASMRGVFDRQGKPFKCDVAGNDKRYGVNIANDNSSELIVFEAAIDMMSYMDIFNDYESNMLALGMLGDAPLETFIKEHTQIKSIRFCLDGDEPGREAARCLICKYQKLGSEVTDAPPPEGFKDYNEWLVKAKKQQQSYSQCICR